MMSIDWINVPTNIFLETRIGIGGYALLGMLAIAGLLLLIRDGASARRSSTGEWIVWLILLVMGAASALGPALRFSGSTFNVSLLSFLPLMLAALWLGVVPAMTTGFVTGLVLALLSTGRLTQPFELALLGGIMSVMLRQPYSGTLADLLRRPLITGLIAVLVVSWPLTVVGMVVSDANPWPVTLDRVLSDVFRLLAGQLAAALIAGLVTWLLTLNWPHPVSEDELETAPWSRQLQARLWYLIVPFAGVSIALLVGLVAFTSYRVATRLVINQMMRDAQTVSEGIPFYIQLGRGLIRDLALDPVLADAGDSSVQDVLSDGLRRVPYFQQFLYFDTARNLQSQAPDDSPLGDDLQSSEETRLELAAGDAAPGEVSFMLPGDAPDVVMSFIVPVEGGGVLVGRTSLSQNSVFTPVTEVLADTVAGSGEGLIVNGDNTILVYPAHPELQGQPLEQVAITHSLNRMGSDPGEAFRQRRPDGSGQLVYRLPVEGQSDWSVIILVPHEVALALASEIALPTLVALIVLILISLLLAGSAVRGVTGPLGVLLDATTGISAGELDHPLHIDREDELGRLGHAFERMRHSLKQRQDEQDQLLRVTRSVASSLDLYRMVPPILSSALDVTGAAGVRIALTHERRDDFETYAAGEVAGGMAVLDRALMSMVQRQGTVVISQLERANPDLKVGSLPSSLHSLVAFPLRSDRSFQGMLWLAYDHPHTFEQSELTFLSTLAGQAAVAVANASLFADAQQGRNQLQAVLESTTDAMIVTDKEGRVTLMNPAAERYFGLRSDVARGRNATEVVDTSPELARLLTNLQEPVTLLELPEQDGRTLLANTSTIVSQEGVLAGRVAVLHDISSLKELDNIKTVFLRMVSHDLRSPLTYMKGYLSMVPLAGDLTQQQRESLTKINSGIEQISELTERLLYLSRLQFGDEAELDIALVDVEEMLAQIYQQNESMFRQKEAAYTIEKPEKLPLVLADNVLYRQAIANLITNALKFIPDSEGEITVGIELTDDNQITIAVKDNGIGIRKEDQERLFEAFFRVPYREGDPKPPRGSGLGLALVKAIADAHAGTVEVDSEFGEGSTFTFTIPLRPPADAG